MKQDSSISSEQIQKAVGAIKKIKPDYAALLDFYEKVFIAQEASKSGINPVTKNIPRETLAIKSKEKFPLIDIPEFEVDYGSSEKLFRTLCGLMQEGNPQNSGSLNKLITGIQAGSVNLKNIFSSFLAGHDDESQAFSNVYSIDEEIVHFLTYNSLQPSITLFSQKLSALLENEEEWGKGYCPVCGAPPVLSAFEKDGKRFLYCGFCWHKWPSKRLYCPFCENSDQDTLHYFDFENEEEHRADVCDRCRKYIKTVDVRKLDRFMYPPLEHLSTAHIDIRIKDMGFECGSESE